MAEVLTYNMIMSKIKRSEIENLYLFYGSETFLIDEVISGIEKKVINPGFKSLNYIKIDGSNANYDSIVNACETMPFMDEKRMVVIDDCSFFKGKKSRDEAKDEGNVENLCSYFPSIPETTVLVLLANGEIDKRTKVYNCIKKNGDIVEFLPMKGQELTKWIIKEFEKLGKTIGVRDASYLGGRVSGGLDELKSEIDKLCSYTGKNNHIAKEDIDLVVSKSMELNIFQLVDSISMRNSGRALMILNDLMSDSEPAIRILAMITRQYRLLLNSKLLSGKGYSDQEIAQKLGVKPFVVSNLKRISNNYSEKQVEDRLRHCLHMDIAMKTGAMEERIALETLIVEFAK